MKRNEPEKWIAVSDLVCGHKYLCYARNFTEGVWNGYGFNYTRNKYGMEFPDIEFHWDDGPPHGTVKPIKDLGSTKEC